jgi:hypothetical protein
MHDKHTKEPQHLPKMNGRPIEMIVEPPRVLEEEEAEVIEKYVNDVNTFILP